MTTYTFSVVATNCIGSGEAGVVMVGEIITTTTTIAPSVESMTIATMSSDMLTSVSIPTASCKDIMTTTTTVSISPSKIIAIALLMHIL